MNPPVLPVDDATRAASVARLGLLDTEAEERFDRLARLAAGSTPGAAAVVALIDTDREWWKATAGLDADATGRAVDRRSSAAWIAVQTVEVTGIDELVVDDAAADARFAGHPLVSDHGFTRLVIRPIRDPEGTRIGAVIRADSIDVGGRNDSAPGTLADVAALVEAELEQRNVNELVAQLVAARQAAESVAERLRLAAGASGIATALLDGSGALLYANPAFAAVLGDDAERLLGRHVDDLLQPDDEAEADRLLGEMRAGVSSLISYDVRFGDGSRWARIHRGRMATGDGSDAELVQIEDTTARHRLEAELRRSEAESRAALDALDQGVILVHHDGHIIRANPAAERMMGYTAAEASALWRSGDWQTFDVDGQVLPPDQRPVFHTIVTGEAVIGRVLSWRRKNGERFLIRLSSVPIDDGSDSIVIAFTDITEEHHAQRLLDTTLETAPVGLAVIDIDRSIVRCNTMFARQSGRTAEELLGLDVTELLSDEPERRDAVAVADEIMATRQVQISRQSERRVARPDGEELWVTTEIALIRDPDQPRAVVATFDVTEQRRLRLDLTRFEYLFRHANDIITVVDADGNVLYASPSSTRVLGYPEEWNEPGGVLSLVHPDDVEKAATEFASLAAGTRGSDPITLRIRAASGEWRHLECVGVNLLDEPAVGGIVITSRDTTERERLTARLAHSATHDDLTDLANRSLLESQLSGSLARAIRDDQRVGLCFIDLDGFKIVNDSYGHAMGDALLVEVARRLRSSIRGGDLAARFGGDEFVVMIDPVIGADEALIAATRIRDAIIADLSHLAPGLRCGASVGVAVSDIDDTSTTLLRRADAALYRAKSLHRSAIELAAESLY